MVAIGDAKVEHNFVRNGLSAIAIVSLLDLVWSLEKRTREFQRMFEASSGAAVYQRTTVCSSVNQRCRIASHSVANYETRDKERRARHRVLRLVNLDRVDREVP